LRANWHGLVRVRRQCWFLLTLAFRLTVDRSDIQHVLKQVGLESD
jgi:hypothetical protein